LDEKADESLGKRRKEKLEAFLGLAL